MPQPPFAKRETFGVFGLLASMAGLGAGSLAERREKGGPLCTSTLDQERCLLRTTSWQNTYPRCGLTQTPITRGLGSQSRAGEALGDEGISCEEAADVNNIYLFNHICEAYILLGLGEGYL
jgi:hypothetical protein